MKSLSAFINEEIVVPARYTDDYALDTKKFVKDLKKYRGLMPNVKHCSILCNTFWVNDEKDIYECVAFTTANKKMNVFAFIDAICGIDMEEYRDNHWDGYLYSVKLVAGPSAEVVTSYRIDNYKCDTIMYSADGNYEQFLKDLCLLVNDYIVEVGQDFDYHPYNYNYSKNTSLVKEFAKNHNKYPTLKYERVAYMGTMPNGANEELVKVF